MPLKVTKLSIGFCVLTVLAGASSALFIIQPEFILKLMQPKTANILGFVLGGIGGICFLAATFCSYKQKNIDGVTFLRDDGASLQTNGTGGQMSQVAIDLEQKRHTVPAPQKQSFCNSVRSFFGI